LASIHLSLIRLIIRRIKTNIQTFLINLFHNIQSKLNRTITNIS
jgi:hypothetical protein